MSGEIKPKRNKKGQILRSALSEQMEFKRLMGEAPLRPYSYDLNNSRTMMLRWISLVPS